MMGTYEEKQQMKEAFLRHDFREVERLQKVQEQRARSEEDKLRIVWEEQKASMTPQQRREMKFQQQKRKREKGYVIVRPCG